MLVLQLSGQSCDEGEGMNHMAQRSEKRAGRGLVSQEKGRQKKQVYECH